MGSPWLKVTALETAWYMRNQLLRDADWAGMAHSVEIRTPMADLEVMRAIAPIAAHGGLKPWKGDLAELPSKPLPHGIVERRKTGFSVPVQDWIAQIDGNAVERGLRGWARHLARRFGFQLSGGSRSVAQLPVN
jgi:asparagine synthase (glutamine-hydrolysing)